ncbi:hypothetical protein MHEI_03990 [Mycobacterium heidelbergense]|nr:hypothetical protein MHEI_03990 [Mycobacterium heidelbergense]
MSIPGFSTIVADVFIAETGADMSVFPTAAHLASWAGVVPGCNESAGRVKSAATRAGNRYLKAASGSRPSRRPAAKTPTTTPATDASPAAAHPSQNAGTEPKPSTAHQRA